MDEFLKFLGHVTWLRILLVMVLTTVATAIVKPYFMHEVSFSYLWVRLFIVGAVMLSAFIIGNAVHAHAFAKRFTLLQIQFIALVSGAMLGTVVSGLVIGRSLNQMVTNDAIFWGMVIFIAVGVSLGVVAATVLVYREQAARAAADASKADAARHELEKQVLEARLKLMQAQIEPHFLFNTLANVQHLVEANPPLAAKTLDSLITYLRAALPEMREGRTTLGREVDMATAYLEIQQTRMGARLQFLRPAAAGAVRFHIMHFTVPPQTKPVQQPGFGVAELNVCDTDFLKSKLLPPQLDVSSQTGEINFFVSCSVHQGLSYTHQTTGRMHESSRSTLHRRPSAGARPIGHRGTQDSRGEADATRGRSSI